MQSNLGCVNAHAFADLDGSVVQAKASERPVIRDNSSEDDDHCSLQDTVQLQPMMILLCVHMCCNPLAVYSVVFLCCILMLIHLPGLVSGHVFHHHIQQWCRTEVHMPKFAFYVQLVLSYT